MTQAVVPASRRAMARVAFIRALASQTAAIRELRAWRLPTSALDSKRESDLREKLTSCESHHISTNWVGLSRTAVFGMAGAERVDAAAAWAEQWSLGDCSWVHKWAVFALLWWNVARWCTLPQCSSGCAAADADNDMNALALVLTLDTMQDLEAQDGQMMTLSAQVGDLGCRPDLLLVGGEFIPLGIRPVVAPLAGPHPLLETKEEFLRRAQTAWDDAVVEIAGQGLSVIVPRKLELHCEWLVRYHVRGETAPEILEAAQDDVGTSRDTSTVYKAVASMADLVGLSIRSLPKT